MSVPPNSPPPADGPVPAGGDGPKATTALGVEPGIAALLAYLLGWVSGLIVFLIEKEHREVRFHAAQSILVSLVLMAAYVVLSILLVIPVINLIALLLLGVLGLVSFALWIYLMIQGYQLNHVKLPFVGDLAETWAAS